MFIGNETDDSFVDVIPMYGIHIVLASLIHLWLCQCTCVVCSAFSSRTISRTGHISVANVLVAILQYASIVVLNVNVGGIISSIMTRTMQTVDYIRTITLVHWRSHYQMESKFCTTVIYRVISVWFSILFRILLRQCSLENYSHLLRHQHIKLPHHYLYLWSSVGLTSVYIHCITSTNESSVFVTNEHHVLRCKFYTSYRQWYYASRHMAWCNYLQ